MTSFNKFIRSGTIPKIVFTLVGVLILLLTLQVGYFLGYRKATFSNNWNKNYISKINGGRSMMAPFMYDNDEINPHGAVGEIISVNLPAILIKRSKGAEEIINIGPKTTIRYYNQIASTSDLVLHKQIIAIGEANEDGQIDATLIRILSNESPSSTTSIRARTTELPTKMRLNR